MKCGTPDPDAVNANTMWLSRLIGGTTRPTYTIRETSPAPCHTRIVPTGAGDMGERSSR